MGKKLYIIFVLTFTYGASAKDWAPKTDGTMQCMVEKFDGKKTFYWCGKQEQTKCADYKHRSWHRQSTYHHGQKIVSSTNNESYYCCDGSSQDAGYFIKGKEWIKESITYTKNLQDGGTCQAVKKINICGGQEIIDCTVPDSCSGGTIMRNKQCTPPCDYEYGFVSETSNQCIECKESSHQGVNNENICIKCDSNTQIFDYATKQCKPKTMYKQYTKDAMKKCWQCDTNAHFKECIAYFTENGVNAPIPQTGEFPAYCGMSGN